VFLAPSRSDLGESLLITTLLGIPFGESDGKTPIVILHPRFKFGFVEFRLNKTFGDTASVHID